MDEKQGPSKADIEKQNARASVNNMARGAGKKALDSFGVPPALSKMIANKAANSKMAQNAMNRVADNPMLRKGLGSKNPALDKANPALNKPNMNPPIKPNTDPNKPKAPATGGAKENENKEKKNPFDFDLFKSKGVIPLKYKLYLIGGIAGFLLFVVIITAVISMVMNPIESLLSLFKVSGQGTTPAQTSFVTKLDEREQYWQSQNIQVDTSIAISLAFTDKSTIISDYACAGSSTTECISKDAINYNQMSDEVIKLIDNQVVSNVVYYCQDKSLEKPDTYLDRKTCGANATSCSTVCKADAKITNSTTYALKTTEQYSQWLLINYIPEKAGELGYAIPTDEASKQALYESMITDATDRTVAIGIEYSPEDSSTGSSVVGMGLAGMVPQNLLDVLGNPLGTVGGTQSSCFGHYGISNSVCHNGIDIVSPNKNQPLYSVADGVVTAVTRNGENRYPDWNANPICDFNVAIANKVEIRHKIIVDGVETVITSKYLHLAIVAKEIKVGDAVTKGQQIGIMGNTGCSTATHLHFQIYDASNKNYNTENLFAQFGCNMISTCDIARVKWANVKCK